MRILGILVVVFILVSCGQKPVSFRAQIQPILNNRCISCHSAANAPDRIVLASYDSLISSKATRWKKPIVVPGKPSESWLYLVCESDQLHFRMPPDTSRIVSVPKDEVVLIGKWIFQGAKNN
jgi:hypothetical protein